MTYCQNAGRYTHFGPRPRRFPYQAGNFGTGQYAPSHIASEFPERAKGLAFRKAMLADAQGDRNGRVSTAEFDRANGLNLSNREFYALGAGPDGQMSIRQAGQATRFLDRNRDGHISQNEVRQARWAMNQNPNYVRNLVANA